MRFGTRRLAAPCLLAPLLVAWALFGGGNGCFTRPRPPPACLDYLSFAGASAAQRVYDYPIAYHAVHAFGVDWVGQAPDAVVADGPGTGCFLGGRLEGTWNPNDSWDLYHDRFGLTIRAEQGPFYVEDLHVLNTGDGVALKPTVPCPSSSSSPWLTVRRSLLEDVHDDAIESDGLCASRIEDNLIDRAFVAFAFRNRSSEPNRNGNGNTVHVKNNLVRAHAFASNYLGQTVHNGFWKWAHGGRGPRISVRDNRFLALDAPAGGTLFPFTNRVVNCANNVLLFAGSEAEWQLALDENCDALGNDGLCDGERMVALGGCYTVITKPDTQSEAAFLAEHWDPYVAAWKSSHSADDE